MSKRPVRRKYLVDRKVQGALLARAARHWLLSVTTVGTLTILGWMFISPGIGELMHIRQQFPSLLGGVAVAAVASLLVLPVILYDLTKMSNRFVGPMFRLRRLMKQAAAGEIVEPIAFRDGDYWQDFAVDFNQLIKRLNTHIEQDELSDIEGPEHSELLRVGE